MNPNRPTATWKLALVGVIGGIVYAVYAVSSGTTLAESAELTTGLGRIGFGAALMASGIAGGWVALTQSQGKDR